MDPLFKKLMYKAQGPMLILESPSEFEPNRAAFGPAEFHTSPQLDSYSFILIFVKSKQDVDRWAEKAVNLLTPDGVLWFAYPKKTSKKYKADIHRDTGWDKLHEKDFIGIRQIAIDEDWSALRFRHRDLIKSK